MQRTTLKPWTRDHPLAQGPELGRPVIVGHHPLDRPHKAESVIAIDARAGVVGAKGALATVLLPHARFATVSAGG